MKHSLIRYLQLPQDEELHSVPKGDCGSKQRLQACIRVISRFIKRYIIWIIISGYIYVPMMIYLFNKIFRVVDIDYSKSGFLIDTNGCHILDLDPFDTRLSWYFEDVETINCNTSGVPSLVHATTSELLVDYEIAPYYTDEPFTCCYRPFSRSEFPKDVNVELGNLTYPRPVDDTVNHSIRCYNINRSVVVTHEFVKVTCSTRKTEIYKEFFAFPKNPYNQGDPQFENGLNSDKLSVLVIGFDGMSRLNFMRQMQRTTDFLEKHNVISLLGYNKVGDNTFPNLIPLLTGYSEETLKQVCWPNEHAVFDNCTFIWDQFKKQGYVTAMGEDGGEGTFNYLRSGFRKKPVDFYSRPFDLVSVKELKKCERLNYYMCIGNELASKFFNNLIKSFVYKMRHQLTFSFFWGNTLSHDFLNIQRHGDVDFLNLLTSMEGYGVFNKTLLILMSDHGIRWGSFRRTLQGFLEERLPFVHFLFPDWFQKKYPSAVANLKMNCKRLTTPFDLHETIKDILDLSKISNDGMDLQTTQRSKKNGSSLFRPISTNRTCKDAGIPDEYCACHTIKPVSRDSVAIREVAQCAVDHMNNLLRNHSECATLDVSTIVYGRLLDVQNDTKEPEKRT